MILKIEANKLVLYFLETKMIFWFVSIQFKHICYINEQKNFFLDVLMIRYALK